MPNRPAHLPRTDAYFTLQQLTVRWSCAEHSVQRRMHRSDTEVRRLRHPTNKSLVMYFADDVRALEKRLGLSVCIPEAN